MIPVEQLAELPSIDPKSFWRVLGVRAIGGSVVAAKSDKGPAGFLGLSVTHVTQTPPTLMVSIGKTTSALQTILDAGHFAVSYLGVEDRETADIFGGRTALKGADRFSPDAWTELATGAPVLRDAVGALDCVLVDRVERFDTVIAFGRIVADMQNPEKQPLIYFRGKTTTVEPE